MAAPAQPRLLFRRVQRLTHARQFQAVYAAKASVSAAGALRIHGKPNGLVHCRLGLSVGRQVGGAVVRNRLKRLLREAFRLEQRAFPMPLDLIISARAHDEHPLSDYRAALRHAAEHLARVWLKREGNNPA